MLTLALDCSTARGSVAIGKFSGPEKAIAVLWTRTFPAGRGHGGELFTTVEEALRGIDRRELSRILVGLGPGSYSGVRQAIALATGLSLATGATLAGLSSTLAIETGGSASAHVIGDARRGTFYYTSIVGDELGEGPMLLDDFPALLARLERQPDWPVFALESVPPNFPADIRIAVALPLAERLLSIQPGLHQIGILEPIYLRPPAITLPNKR